MRQLNLIGLLMMNTGSRGDVTLLFFPGLKDTLNGDVMGWLLKEPSRGRPGVNM